MSDSVVSMHQIHFCLYRAGLAGENRHPIEVMSELGIGYEKAVPQSLGDMWQFFDCTIPSGMQLPSFIYAANKV